MTTAALLLLSWLSTPLSAQPAGPGGGARLDAPEVPGGRVAEYETSLRSLWKVGALEPMGELTTRWETEHLRAMRALTLGSYWRAHRNLKLGAFYRLQYGVRHDNDWVVDERQWFWRENSRRSESVLILDASPRVQLPFLPGENWVATLKTQYQWNAHNGNQTARAGPELSYHWLDGLKARAAVSVAYDVFLPLNYGRSLVYDEWIYLSALWHGPRGLSAGPTVALRRWTWSAPSEFEALGGDPYVTTQKSVVYGLNVVARFSR